jgi:predicted nuclease of restriction endonuclease-like RecB superfamily
VTTPNYLTARDYPWLLVLIEEYERYEGRRSAELAARLREPLRVECGAERLALARRVLDQVCKPTVQAAVPPPQAREALFRSAAGRGPRADAARAAAESLRVDPRALFDALFADLPGERRMPELPQGTDPANVALRANLSLVAGLLGRATAVTIGLRGNARDIVRCAQLRGLLCVVRGEPEGAELRLEISGPLSIFRRTLVYGRALASLVPRLAHCERFELRAECTLYGQQQSIICVRSGDPIFPSDPPKRFDSQVERRFARDFARAAPDWDIVREPSPVAAEGTLIFPDFALVHRRNPNERAWLEIVGFWTPGYLEEKLRRLRAAGLSRLILCIDAERNCGADEMPQGAQVIRYERRIDPHAVLAVLVPVARHR